MPRYRSFLALVLAFLTAFLVSCGTPEVKKPPTYTTAQSELIQQYVSGIEASRDRLPELAKLVQDENWVFVRNFIRGPLGELRSRIAGVERNLLPDARPKAREAAKELFESLVLIDQAAQNRNYKAAISNYAEIQKNLNAFLALAPKA
ncbi:photosystem II protein PsbQ [Argonema antarcticum]|uniref:photosystem II protein PsbQ n=1 Tax=Argonema antarcticum TaxID=2942763 RepID=UPI002012130B|nr:photosystem II protein PsbQ [Argonema antarcticum]MCL1474502.1 photosystem II protein PsbQ [Argonema antarcticum A004/B2]